MQRKLRSPRALSMRSTGGRNSQRFLIEIQGKKDPCQVQCFLHLARISPGRTRNSSVILFFYIRLRNGMAIAGNIGMMLPQNIQSSIKGEKQCVHCPS